MQSSQDVLLQKCRFSLLASGKALILFSIWTVISASMEVYTLIHQSPEDQSVSFWAVAGVILAFNGIDLILKLIAGFTARAEGRGRYHHSILIVLGILVAALSVYNIISYLPLIPCFYENSGLLRVIITIAVEVTVIYAALDLVISAVKIRKLSKETGPRTA